MYLTFAEIEIPLSKANALLSERGRPARPVGFSATSNISELVLF